MKQRTHDARMKKLVALLTPMLAMAVVPASSAEPESDDAIYMKAAMLHSTLSQCLLLGKDEGKAAKKAYADWLEPRHAAVSRVAGKGCGQMCQMLGDPLRPLQKPPKAQFTGSLASLNMSADDSRHLCEQGMKAAAEPTVEPAIESEAGK